MADGSVGSGDSEGSGDSDGSGDSVGLAVGETFGEFFGEFFGVGVGAAFTSCPLLFASAVKKLKTGNETHAKTPKTVNAIIKDCLLFVFCII